MANAEQLALLKQGMTEWNYWRDSHPDTPIDLSGVQMWGANLGGRNLQGADLRDADLSGAIFLSAHLQGVNMTDARLLGAQLDGANLTDATLAGARLTGAQIRVGISLTGAILQGVNFQQASLQAVRLDAVDLTGSDLTGADLRETIFSHVTLTGMNVTNAVLWLTQWDDVDLSEVIGLETVRHLGPSTIGLDTLLASHGQIPDVFLRGCGVSDDLIAFAHTLARTPQYPGVFLAYDAQNQALGTRLSADLQANHVRCWTYPLDLMGLGRISLSSAELMRTRQKKVVLISHSATQSQWLPHEIETALELEELFQRDILVPIILDAALLHEEEEWAQRLRERHTLLNFIGWEEPSTYASMLEQLLDELKLMPTSA